MSKWAARLDGATVARLTPDQTVGRSNRSGLIFSANRCARIRAHPGSNQGPADLQSAALPLSYTPVSNNL